MGDFFGILILIRKNEELYHWNCLQESESCCCWVCAVGVEEVFEVASVPHEITEQGLKDERVLRLIYFENMVLK